MADLKQTLLDAIHDAAPEPQTMKTPTRAEATRHDPTTYDCPIYYAPQKRTPYLGAPFSQHRPISRPEAAQWLKANRRHGLIHCRGYYLNQARTAGLATR
jgi:hypothetical protein